MPQSLGYGIITAKKVPASIVNKLATAITEALQAPDVVQRLTADGSDISGTTPEQFSAHIKSEIAKWTKLVKASGMKFH